MIYTHGIKLQAHPVLYSNIDDPTQANQLISIVVVLIELLLVVAVAVAVAVAPLRV